MVRFNTTPIIVVAALAASSEAFSVRPTSLSTATRQQTTSFGSFASPQIEYSQTVTAIQSSMNSMAPMDTGSETKEASPMQATVAAPQPTEIAKPAPKKKAGGAQHAGGIFAPIVRFAKRIVGDDTIIKLRGKIIGYHTKAIGSFVDTHETASGTAAMRTLFDLADTDNSGSIDEAELGVALRKLGFELGEKQIKGIFKRADKDGNGTICWDEFQAEAPKTLKTNLTKLAKRNGGDMGLMA